MKTVEEVEAELGIQPHRGQGGSSSGCGYNPGIEYDPAADCNQPSSWHVQVRSSDASGITSLLACEQHVSRIIAGPYADTVISFHEIGSACGLEGSWWIDLKGDAGSACFTLEKGLEMGLLERVEDEPV
jgi:hypothetical protein